MFGYITPDKPNMYIKDYTVYRAFYCGICKCTGKMNGQLMRCTTNYDITFISILLHNILEQKMEISNESCILNPIKKKSIVKVNDLMKLTVNLNTLLIDYKLNDDIKDNGKFLSKFTNLMIRRKVRKARRALPDISARIERAKLEQIAIEKSDIISIDRAAHPFASMIRDVFQIVCKDKYTEDIGSMTYQLGRLIYIVDAIEDYDDDKRKGQYNPLLKEYPDIIDKNELLNNQKEDIDFMLYSAYDEIKRNYQSMDCKICEGVVTNILWYGIDKTINRVLTGGKLCQTTSKTK